jgi:hypothetical protein
LFLDSVLGFTPFMTWANKLVIPAPPTTTYAQGRCPSSPLSLAATSSFLATVPYCRLPGFRAS